MTKLYRVTQTRVALVRAVDPEEAIRIERDRGALTGGAITVTEITGDELARLERERAPRSPSTFEMQAVRDTDPAPPIPREEPEG